MKIIGFIDEVGQFCEMAHPSTLDFKYFEAAGLDLTFSMQAREFRDLVARAQTIHQNGTTNEKSALLTELVNLLEQARL